MGTKERRDRERLELRQSILEASRDIAAREGWQSVSMRKVAERIEYSPPTIYEHFASKEAILLDLTREGHRMLLAAIQAAQPAGDPASGLIAAGRAYWEFAWTYPELYQVMHGLGGVPFCAEDAAKASGVPLLEAEALAQATAQLIQMLPTMAEASAAELDDNVHMIWATMHGLVALTMAGRIQGDRTQGLRLVDRAICDFLAARGVTI